MEQPVKAAGWDLSVQGTQWGQGAGYMSLPLTLERRESHGSFKQETDLPFKESSLAAIGRTERSIMDGVGGGWPGRWVVVHRGAGGQEAGSDHSTQRWFDSGTRRHFCPD